MDTDDKVQFSLLENGLDFISSAVTHLEGQLSDRDLKYSLIHMEAGIELILKQCLELEDWELVIANQNKKIKRENYQAGDFISVSLDECIKRLEEYVDIEIPPEQKRIWNNLKRMRNKMQHFMILETPEAIQSLIEKGLSSILDFIASKLPEESFFQKEIDMLRDLRTKLKGLETFIEDRMKQIDSQLTNRRDSSHLIVQCPLCMQDALVINDSKDLEEGAHCYFCRYWNPDSYTTAEEYIKNILKVNPYYIEREGLVWPHYECPACRSFSLVDAEKYICFSCGTSWEQGELDSCYDCQRLIEDYEEALERGGRCSECFDDMIRSDHT